MAKETSNQSPSTSEAEEILDADIIDEDVIETAAEGLSPSKPADAKDIKSANWGARTGWGLALILLIFAGGVFSAPWVKGPLTDLGLIKPMAVTGSNRDEEIARLSDLLTVNERTLKALAQNLEQLGEDVDGLKERAQSATLPPGESVDAGKILAYGAELDEIRAQLSALQNLTTELSSSQTDISPQDNNDQQVALALMKQEQARLFQALAAANKRLVALESGQLTASPGGRLVLALGRIREKALGGDDIRSDMARLAGDMDRLPGASQPVVMTRYETLLGLIQRPLLSERTLASTFESHLSEALVARDKEDGNFLAGLVTVRRLDDQGDADERRLEQARRSMEMGDLATAANSLDGLSETMGSRFQEWRQEVARTLRARREFDGLIDTIAASGPIVTGFAQDQASPSNQTAGTEGLQP